MSACVHTAWRVRASLLSKSADLLGNTEKEIIMNRYSPSPTRLTSSVPPTTIQRDNGGGARPAASPAGESRLRSRYRRRSFAR